MLEQKRLGWITFGMAACLSLSVGGLLICMFALAGLPKATNIPFHSMLECAGGIAALGIAGILLAESERRQESRPFNGPIAASLVGMGVLDLLHSAVLPGKSFVWLHSSATLVGGLLAVGACFPESVLRRFSWWKISLGVLIGSSVMGSLSCFFPQFVPEMVSAGSFTTSSRMLNFVGGAGFLAATVVFVRHFLQSGHWNDWLFAMFTCLFGLAGLLFEFSELWNPAWWWWHVLRLAAYVVALAFALETYLHAEHLMASLNRELAALNAGLDQTVAQRTAALCASEERFALAVRGSNDGLWDWNVLTGEVFYSPRFKELLGFDDAEFPNQFASFDSRLHSDDRAKTLESIRQHVEEEIPYDVQYRLKTKPGDYRWFRARGQAIWKDGRAVRMAGSITDITAEHRLQERVQFVVEACPTALLVIDGAGTIAMVNSRTESDFGYSRSELLGREIESLIPERLREECELFRADALTAPALRPLKVGIEIWGRRKDGSEFPIEVGLIPIETEEGRMILCGANDITHQKQAVIALAEAKEHAEAASRAKSSFLANMSHEIRTPMNGIIGMSQLLHRTALNSLQLEYVETISDSADILLRLLNDILDFSKIEAGRLELESIEFSLSVSLSKAIRVLSLRAAEKNLELVCRIAPEIPDQLVGDPGRLGQVFVNLVGNAIKFTEAGEVFVDMNLEEMNDGKVRLHSTVKDTGIGIPSDKIEQIFKPFEQAEASTTRRFGGTGLGLTISSQLVQMMNGRIWVESEVGRGTTFHFIVEMQVVADPKRPRLCRPDVLQRQPILVVDDNETNRRVLSEMLAAWEMQPVLADGAAAGQSALEQSAADGRPIRFVLLDCAMPGADGFEFAQWVRQRPEWTDLPIIMISSSMHPGDDERCREFQIARLMQKPVLSSELLNAMLEAIAEPSIEIFATSTMASRKPLDLATDASFSTSHSGSPSLSKPRRILLVEDNPVNRRVAQGLLHLQGHEVVLAENGRIAIDILAREEFDLVLMDMQMPEMDGYEATVKIRESERNTGGHLPIIAMTAEAMSGDAERCLATGMDDYISKPIDSRKLYVIVEKYPAVCLTHRVYSSK